MVEIQHRENYDISNGSFHFDCAGTMDPSISVQFDRQQPFRWNLCLELSSRKVWEYHINIRSLLFGIAVLKLDVSPSCN